MYNRNLPGKIEEEEFNRKYRYLCEFLGEDWINRQHSNIPKIKEFLHRKDLHSSVEIYTIASAIEEFNITENTEWFQEYKNLAKQNKVLDFTSKTYELVSASAFNFLDQKTILCPPAKPGYDFEVKFNDKKIRVSCKKLFPSDQELSFRKKGLKIYETAYSFAKEHNINNLDIRLLKVNPRSKVGDERIEKEIINLLATYSVKKKAHEFRKKSIHYMVSPLICNEPMYRFHPRKTSINFLFLSPYATAEQIRFENLFKKSANNFKKYCNNVDKNCVNMLMVGVPPAISLQAAENWLNKQFGNKYYSTVTCVFLNRFTPAFDMKDGRHIISYECKFVLNKNAKILWDEFNPNRRQLNLKLEFCKPKEEGKNLILSDFGALEITNMYHMMKGTRYYEIANPIEGKFDISLHPGISYNLVFYSLVFSKNNSLINYSMAYFLSCFWQNDVISII